MSFIKAVWPFLIGFVGYHTWWGVSLAFSQHVKIIWERARLRAHALTDPLLFKTLNGGFVRAQLVIYQSVKREPFVAIHRSFHTEPDSRWRTTHTWNTFHLLVFIVAAFWPVCTQKCLFGHPAHVCGAAGVTVAHDWRRSHGSLQGTVPGTGNSAWIMNKGIHRGVRTYLVLCMFSYFPDTMLNCAQISRLTGVSARCVFSFLEE